MVAYDAACQVEAAVRAVAARVDLACKHEQVEDARILVAGVREAAMFDERRPETDSS